MPITKQLTPQEALKRIADVCKLQADNIAAAKLAVAASFNSPNSADGPNVTLHRNVVEGLESALTEILDASDLTITIG